MPLSQIKIYGNTLRHPIGAFYNGDCPRWEKDQLVNQALDLLKLLELLGDRDANFDINSVSRKHIYAFLFPSNNILGGEEQARIFKRMLDERNANGYREPYASYALKRASILKLIANLSIDDYATVRVLFDELDTSINKQQYEQALAILCRSLKQEVAKLNGLQPQNDTPVNIFNTIVNLQASYTATQHSFCLYDNNDGYKSPQSKNAIRQQKIALTLTALTLIMLAVTIDIASAGAIALFISAAIGCCYYIYEATLKLQERSRACEASHRQFDIDTRKTLGLPEPVQIFEEEEPGYVDRATSSVHKLYIQTRSWIQRRDDIETDPHRYTVLEDEEDEENRQDFGMQPMG